MRRRVGVLAAGVATLLLAAGCPKDREEPSPDVTDATGMVWSTCFDRAKEINGDLTRRQYTVECGTVTVPKDWNEPDSGETFDIAVMRIYTGELADKQGSVVTNPGGPGGSGLDFLPSLIAFRGAPGADALLDDFALVSFDPRGVGDSAAVDCFSDADLDAMIALEPDPVSQAAFDELVALSEQIAQGCENKYGDDLGLFSTVQAAKDMEAIREALGDEKLTYLGFSYGTLLGAVYAQLFPDRVRAFVLDGAVDPTQSPVESSKGQAMGFERALTNFTAWCRQNAAQCPISADPRAAITEQLERTAQMPVVGAGGREATAGWVYVAVLLSMYTQDAWPYLGPAIDDLSQGDPDLVFFLADLYVERDEDGHYSNLFAANSAVNCADEEYPSLQEIRDLQDEWREEYPVFGASSAAGLVMCSVWPAQTDPYPTGPANGAPKIVVVGTTGDPATPYESTQKLADMLGRDVGVVVTFDGEGHTAYPGSPCINEAVEKYLIDLEVPRDGLRCT